MVSPEQRPAVPKKSYKKLSEITLRSKVNPYTIPGLVFDSFKPGYHNPLLVSINFPPRTPKENKS